MLYHRILKKSKISFRQPVSLHKCHYPHTQTDSVSPKYGTFQVCHNRVLEPNRTNKYLLDVGAIIVNVHLKTSQGGQVITVPPCTKLKPFSNSTSPKLTMAKLWTIDVISKLWQTTFQGYMKIKGNNCNWICNSRQTYRPLRSVINIYRSLSWQEHTVTLDRFK